jgi:two-component system invasion response regulator UvrY
MGIRILLADSHPAILTTLSRFLCSREDVEVVGQANTGPAAVELSRQLKPDIVLMDVDASVLPGMDAVRQIHREQPGVKIILWSIDPWPPRLRETVKAAASGYLLKDCDPETLLTAIRTVAAGGTYVSPESDCRPPDEPGQET